MPSYPSAYRLRALALIAMAVVAGCAATPDTAVVPMPPSSTATWSRLATEAYTGKQDDIAFVDERLGFYVNGKGRIYRTDDGGERWTKVLDQPGTYFRAIGFVDAQRGFAGNIGTDYFPGVTDTRPLYATRDGGRTWNAVDGLPGAPMKGICAIDIVRERFINAGVLETRTVIHAGGRVGGPAQLLRSLDGGQTWTAIDMSPWVAMIVDVKFFDANNGIVFAGSDASIERSNALIVRTRDGGRTWTQVYRSARPFEITWKGHFPTERVGYATIQTYQPDASLARQRIAKTTDGGATWKEMDLVVDPGARQFGIGFATPDLGWVGTAKGGFETRDGGLTWRPVQLGRAVNKIRLVPASDGMRAYAIGADVYRFGPPRTASGPSDAAPVSVGKP